jgi:trk system potassium uptake protein TrkA
VRHGDVAAVHSLRRGAAEAIELVAHGDRSSSQVVGRRICELPVIEGAHIGCIVRAKKVIIAHADTVIEADDHVILFLVSKRLIPKVEKLFQVGLRYL